MQPTPAPRRRRAPLGLLSLLATTALLLAGCGGGAYVEIEGPPPEITLTTSVTDAVRGQPVQLAAAVTASNGLDHVDFYRIDFGRSVFLGSTGPAQLRWDTAIPINAASQVSYFAQACDLAGYCTSSRSQTIFVYP